MSIVDQKVYEAVQEIIDEGSIEDHNDVIYENSASMEQTEVNRKTGNH